MVTLVASPINQKCNAIWPRKALRHFVLGLATKHHKMVEKNNPTFVNKFGFTDPKWNLLSWCFDSRTNSHLWTFVLCSFLPSYLSWNMTCRKIPQISPGTCIFQRPFLRGLCLEWLIWGCLCTEGSLRFKIDWASLWLEGNLPFLLCFTLYFRAIFQVQDPGGLYLEGRFHRGFFVLRV